MARVTVEDCIEKVDNRFELVLLAAHRARMISNGSQLTLDRDNDKNPVVALREIAEATVQADVLHEELIHSLQKRVEVDEPEMEADLLDETPDGNVAFDQYSQEDLLKAVQSLAPPERREE